MLVSIASHRVPLTRSLSDYIRQALSEKLRPFAHAIRAARAELSDRNGRRGGGDKRCRIELTLSDGTQVKHDDIRANVRNAFHRALDRTASAAHRRLRAIPR